MLSPMIALSPSTRSTPVIIVVVSALSSLLLANMLLSLQLPRLQRYNATSVSGLLFFLFSLFLFFLLPAITCPIIILIVIINR